MGGYKPAILVVAIHSIKKAMLSSNPSSIGIASTPIEEDTQVALTLILADKNSVGISSKTLHIIGVDGVEITTKVTDANGQATYGYTVTGDDNGKSLTIKYLGD